jgi:hypothetical protein
VSFDASARRRTPPLLEIDRFPVLSLRGIDRDARQYLDLMRGQRRPRAALSTVGDAGAAIAPTERGAVRMERSEVRLLALDGGGLLGGSLLDWLPLGPPRNPRPQARQDSPLVNSSHVSCWSSVQRGVNVIGSASRHYRARKE